jgi:ADP-ribose pyrophosphatase YjhB (NUDIX family)
MAKHVEGGQVWWCLPGGGVEPGETPEQAALRELNEECGVAGRIVRETCVCADPELDIATISFLVDIGDQEPALGCDPDLPEGREPILQGIRWMTLSEIPERDRAFLWAAGLLAVPGYWKEVEGWGNALSYPTDA